MRCDAGMTECESDTTPKPDLWRVTVPHICEKTMLISSALLFITTWVAQFVIWGHRPPSLAENAIDAIYGVLFIIFTLPWLVYLVLFLYERLFCRRAAHSTKLWGVAMPLLVIFACAVLQLSYGVPW